MIVPCDLLAYTPSLEIANRPYKGTAGRAPTKIKHIVCTIEVNRHGFVMNFIKTLFILWCVQAVPALAATGDIVRCIQSDGSVVYTNLGCGDDRMEQVVLTPLTIVESTETNPSFLNGVHVSFIQWVLSLYVLMSALCFWLYWLDKKRSISGEWRIPEKTLHLLECLGGWPGALLAQRKLRHKNRKGSYQFTFWLIVLVHVLLWVWVVGLM